MQAAVGLLQQPALPLPLRREHGAHSRIAILRAALSQDRSHGTGQGGAAELLLRLTTAVLRESSSVGGCGLHAHVSMALHGHLARGSLRQSLALAVDETVATVHNPPSCESAVVCCAAVCAVLLPAAVACCCCPVPARDLLRIFSGVEPLSTPGALARAALARLRLRALAPAARTQF